jgi:flagellar hook-length control protein FliK
MALPVVTSVTKEAAPASSSSTKPANMESWSGALEQAQKAAPTKADAVPSTKEGSANEGKEAADTKNFSIDLKAEKRKAASSTAPAQAEQKDAAKTAPQTANPFAIMLLDPATPQAVPAGSKGVASSGAKAKAVPSGGANVDSATEISTSTPDTKSPATSAEAKSSGKQGTAAPDVMYGAPAPIAKATVAAVQPPQTAITVAQQRRSTTVVNQASQEPEAKQTTTVAPDVTKTASMSTVASLAARSTMQQVGALAIGTEKLQTTKQFAVSPVAQVSGSEAYTQAPAATPLSAASAPASAPDSGSVDASSSSALAASVTAMHQSGQSGAVLRLDPPGLGNLSVHVALSGQGQVNVLFVPDSSAGAQALQSGLGGLAQSMAQSGLTLGQAQVGGQFSQNAGQGGGQSPQTWKGGGTSAPAQAKAPEGRDISGVRAYA